MKPTRIFATASLIASSIALIAAANISVGDEGVVRMSSFSQDGSAPVPTPDPQASEGVATMNQAPVEAAPPEIYPQPGNFAPYFERSMGATGVVPGMNFQPTEPFGPIMMFESNLDNGLGYGSGYQRFNARVPMHVIPNTSVLIGDMSASITWDGSPIFNGGVIWRNYDEARNRVFGWNGFFDYDEGYGHADWTRVSGGFESLGKYIDFRGNAYFIAGDRTALISSDVSNNLNLSGNTVYKMRTNIEENAYSGFDLEMGGPLPLLGRYGFNAYPGVYYLTNGSGGEATGFQMRWEALITQNVTVNTYLTTDDKFDTNTWVSLQYEIPNYRERRTLKPRRTRERLMDAVVRQHRIQTHIDSVVVPEVVTNAGTGAAYNIIHVDPNAALSGTGTFESPFNTLQAAAAANSGAVDIIRIKPRNDNTGTNLTVNGGISLFDDQVLMSSLKPLTLAPDCIIPGDTFTGAAPEAPLVMDPVMVAGGSVIRVANGDSVIGLRIDASNTANTVFGNGISNPLPITDTSIICNEITDYVTAVSLQDVTGTVIVDQNMFEGRAGTSVDGLNLTIAAGSTADVLIRDNVASDNSNRGLSLVAQAGSTVNADDPNGVGGQITGVLDNVATNNGTGIHMEARTGATINAVVEGNTSTSNTADGFAGVADAGTFNLASMSGNAFSQNTSNGAFIHYLNGGVFNSVSEDLDGDGSLDGGEDLNGNGRLDHGIVTNVFSSNTIAGICIFGEDASIGRFDIGGPTSALGNQIIGNLNAGIAVDLRDTATAQMDVVNNVVSSAAVANNSASLTYVLDFIDAGQNVSDPFFGGNFTPFDVTSFGFAASDYGTVTNAVLDTVRQHFYNIPTTGADNRSPIPDGKQLDINFVIGDFGTAPSTGATEYYYAAIGTNTAAPAGVLGVAELSGVRNATGTGPNGTRTNGSVGASIFSNAINGITGLTPADIAAIPAEPPGVHYDIGSTGGTQALTDALTSGNLAFTRNALGGTISHEIGHSLSLSHINVAGSVQPTGLPPIMGTGAIDLPVQARIGNREFSYDGFDGENGNAPRQHVAQLLAALGTRDATTSGVSGDGIRINATDSATLQPSTILRNTITNNSGDGVSVVMNDNAQATDLTIKTNTITGNSGTGINLEANGPGAFIDADSTIGGSGVLVLGGSTFSEGNTISNNQGDGIRALASSGGIIHGNAINNSITQNAGNGISLQIDDGGEIDFGTTASNRKISGNTITGNGGAGVRLTSNATASSEALMRATILGNTISSNVSGGIISNQNGTNHNPPAIPVVVNNNRLFLDIGGTAAADANTIDQNGDAGIGVNVTGNSSAIVNMTNVTVTNTVNGPDPLMDGDGINLRRADASYLEAHLNKIVSTGNAADGIHVDTQGNDKNDPNQPFSGTPNTVEILDSNFSNNGANGAFFRTRGDSTLIADITQSTFQRNGANGILVQTSEHSSFGDPTIGLPPGRRSVFDGLFVDSNGVDGIQIQATEESRALVEVTSTAAAATGSPHAAASTLGNTAISNNASDGIHIITTGGRSDVLITSGTATTTITNNGTAAGGNGIRWDASGDSDGTVRVTRTLITNNRRGGSEDTNGNGTLDAGEDVNNNGDIDVTDGDGIQANFSETTQGTLIVGNVGDGNVIQGNQDDGIAVTATGSNATGNPRPIITISSNTIGGTNAGLDAGNLGDGVQLDVFGGTAVGIAPANVDFTLPGLSFNDGVTESGAIPQFTMTQNLVSNNDRRGVNIALTGASGTRDREFGASTFDPVRITLDDNTIMSNGNEGVFYRADSQMNQSRFVYLANFPDPPVTGNQNLNYSPFRPEFFSMNVGSVNGNTAYQAPYLNLRTVQNSFLTLTNNTIQNNGVNTVTGEGVRLEVGTGAYLAADVRGNAMGGNLEEDFVTTSFLSFGNTFNSVDTNGDQTFDYVYLDDTAQLDLRFQNNSGNQILPSDVGAIYTNADPLKAQFFGVGVVNRDASLFQVDNGPNLNSPNNQFINFALTQDIQNAFTVGGYNLRGAADPAFPNIGFAPFLP